MTDLVARLREADGCDADGVRSCSRCLLLREAAEAISSLAIVAPARKVGGDTTVLARCDRCDQDEADLDELLCRDCSELLMLRRALEALREEVARLADEAIRLGDEVTRRGERSDKASIDATEWEKNYVAAHALSVERGMEIERLARIVRTGIIDKDPLMKVWAERAEKAAALRVAAAAHFAHEPWYAEDTAADLPLVFICGHCGGDKPEHNESCSWAEVAALLVEG